MTTRIDVDKLLAQTDIVALANSLGAEIKKKGHEWRGICPIHGGDNKTAFRVYTDNDNRERWYCYTGCNTGGDAIDLIRQTENLDFIGAVEWLADYAGVAVEDIGMTPEAAKAYEQRKLRTDVLTLAAQYFAQQLWLKGGQQCLTYARSRGFDDDALVMA
ncbi:MAG: CHC2 zinc finger domain-containing protein, partial [Chloroflexota bacterium]|nr:CHC2 zinc finger domain-containing protein [Chloroflexota bacterium]